ncbi:hypothetical protein PFISCL1PPCAC_4707, partial [Pristionchus fissidentatus]
GRSVTSWVRQTVEAVTDRDVSLSTESTNRLSGVNVGDAQRASQAARGARALRHLRALLL